MISGGLLLKEGEGKEGRERRGGEGGGRRKERGLVPLADSSRSAPVTVGTWPFCLDTPLIAGSC